MDSPKKPSGASNRRKKHESEAAANPDTEPDGGDWAQAFRAAGDPDLENPETDLDYTRKLQLIVLQQMATTPFPPRAQQDCWRRIREMSATLGMTSSRAALESTV